MESLIPDSCPPAADSGYGTSTSGTTPEFESVPLADPSLCLDFGDFPAVPNIQAELSVPSAPNLWTHRDTILYILNVVDPGELEIVISGPTGHRYPVQPAARLSDRLAVTFRPLLPGTYVVGVFLRGIFHVNGSPALLNVSRDYSTVSRPIVSLDILALPDATEEMDARRPWGLACNTNTEQLLVCDRGRHEILVFGPDGEPAFKFGKFGSGLGEFHRPAGIAYDATADRILVSDKENHRVQIFSPRGEFLSTFGSMGSQPGEFLFPWGVAVSPDGTLIAVADSKNHRVQVFDSEGKFLSQFRTGSSTDKSFPRGIAFNNSGTVLYVTDFNGHSVLGVDVACTSSVPVVPPGSLRHPTGVQVDSVGNLIVANSKHNCVKIFRPDGTFVRRVERIGAKLLDLPIDIALMKAGYLAILELNGQISVI